MRYHFDRARATTGLAVAALSVSCLGLTFSAARKNRQGGELYLKGDYENALKRYSEAMTEAPEKPQVYFNIGDVLYRQSKFPEAVKLYEKSAAPGDPSLRAKSWYNIGNAQYRAAKQGGATQGGGQVSPQAAAGPGGGIEALREAAASYVKSLEFDPDDMDAKYNLEFVQREVKRQEEQQQQDRKDQQKDQQQQQDQQKQEQEKQEQEKKDQEEQDQEKQEQEKKEQEKEEREKQDQEKKEEQGYQEEQKEQEQKQKEQEEQDQAERKETPEAKQEEQPAGEAPQAERQGQPEKEMSEQQARQLIEALEREERDPTHLIKAAGSPQPRGVDRDW